MKITVQKATLCLLIKDDKILLALKKKGFGKDLWNGVGGKIEPGETPKQAAIREAQEEIEVTPTNLKRVARIDFHFPKKTGKERWVERVFVYTTFNWVGEPIETQEMRPKWFNLKKIPYQKMWSDDILWIPLVLGGKKIKAKFWFDENNQVKKHQIWDID